MHQVMKQTETDQQMDGQTDRCVERWTFATERAYLATLINTVVDLFEKIPLPAPLGIPYGGGVCGFRDQQVGATLVYGRGSKMAVWRHVVVTLQSETHNCRTIFNPTFEMCLGEASCLLGTGRLCEALM